MDTRKKMLERVKALLAKTMVNGCTEGEALAALDKARELMAAYEINESDLIPEDEKARIHATGYYDPYGIKKKIAYAVQKFTRCRAWVSSRTGVTFCGLDSDVEFAAWLLDTLSHFVQRELKAFRAAEKRKGRPTPRIVSCGGDRGFETYRGNWQECRTCDTTGSVFEQPALVTLDDLSEMCGDDAQ